MAREERTVKEMALGVMSEETWEEHKQRAILWMQQAVDHGVVWLWNRYELADQPLHEMIPGWSPALKQQWSYLATDGILDAVRSELTSMKGQRMLRQLASQLVGQTGGFLGAMATMFMDEEKLVQKMTPVLVEQLESEQVRGAVSQFIERKMDEITSLPLEQVFRTVTGEDGVAWLSRQAQNVLQWKHWVEKIEEMQVSSLVSRYEERLIAYVPRGVQQLLTILQRMIPNIMKAIQLPQLVREQVERFPIERLEHVILSVSGREFQAITWLGALLGGLIGLFQAIFMLWLG
jgi:uncharacterized membrane protein YheB (UPF0754 family)